MQREITVERNHLHDFMGSLMDGGGIFCLSASPGSVARGSYVHGSRVAGPGIYLDEGSRYILVEHNVIDDMPEAISEVNKPKG